jgi:glyoxylase I family protein
MSSVASTKGVDVGIVIRDSESALRFYRDTLGLKHVADVPALSGTMHRLQWGSSTIKLTRPEKVLEVSNPPGGFLRACGIRYLTLTVDDLDALVTRCEDAGFTTAVPRTEVRPGVVIAVVEDPEGNWVEFLQA